MGEKDITEKTLETYNDVFADIINVLLFQGSSTVREDDLEDAVLRYHYKADGGKLHEMERDAAKYWLNSNIRIAFFGNENQTASDMDAPLRGAGYDGAEYRRQLLADFEETTDENGKKKTIKKRKPRFPVITLFLYFGYQKHWDKPLTLHECLNIPEGLKPYVNDYKVNLFEIAWLSDEQLAMFQSDFRIVADYFVQMRKNNDYKPKPENFKHIHETLELMSVLTNDQRYEDVWFELRKEAKNMCVVLDRIENKGRSEGILEGKIEGKNLIIQLNNILLDSGRIDDLKRASKDEDYLNQLLEELIFSKY